jgi:hypothetical protein
LALQLAMQLSKRVPAHVHCARQLPQPPQAAVFPWLPSWQDVVSSGAQLASQAFCSPPLHTQRDVQSPQSLQLVAGVQVSRQLVVHCTKLPPWQVQLSKQRVQPVHWSSCEHASGGASGPHKVWQALKLSPLQMQV